MIPQFKIGDVVICDCPQKCNIMGKVIHIDYREEVYVLEKGEAFFTYARLATPLEQAMK